MSEQVVQVIGAPVIESAIRAAMRDPQKKKVLLEKTGWTDTVPGKIASGEMGVSLDKLDKVLEALGLVVVEKEYFRATQTLSKVGVNCECARAGIESCGIRWG